MAGYSGTPLPKKLGIKVGGTVGILNEPKHLRRILKPLPEELTFRTTSRGKLDVAVLFVTRRSELMRRLPGLTRAIFPAGGLWIAWPKKASKVPTDITEDVLRTLILPTGLVDNKVCAIDEIWSGLRFVHRKENR